MAESISICRHNKNGTGYCEYFGEYCVEGPCNAEELLEYAPVRHGRWMPYSTTMMICSVCERHTAKHRFEYCPHCGCKMDKEE